MIATKISTYNHGQAALEKVKSLGELMKARLSLLVTFSAGFGYVLGVGAINWLEFAMLCMGGFLISGASVTINQILEIEFDKQMERTKNRPLPTGRVSMNEALVFAVFCMVTGLFLLLKYTNLLTASLSLLSLLLYSFVYTPLKRVGPIAVLVGAVPGALPPLLGWTAATGSISAEALVIFGIQFIWQFPHFWAIAWTINDDYKKAGFRMLPSAKGKTGYSAFVILIHSIMLIPVSIAPYIYGLTGITMSLVIFAMGVFFAIPSFKLFLNHEDKAAKKLMFASFIYLPVVLLALFIDKLI